MDAPQDKPPTLRLIIAYKVARGILSLLAGAGISLMLLTGAAQTLHGFAYRVNEDANSALAQDLSALLITALESRHVWIALLALVVDGIVVLFEGYALNRGWRWASWLVVATTSALLPFEVVALIHHVAPGRVTLLVLNALIVMYLVWSRLEEGRRERRPPIGAW